MLGSHSAAIRTARSLASKHRSAATPEVPAMTPVHVDATSEPSGDTQPMPVTTTRRRRPACPSMLGMMLVLPRGALPDVRDGVGDGLDLLCVLVRDLDVELFFHRHHELDDVERVGAEIVDEGSLRDDFFLRHTELLDDDLGDAVFESHSLVPSEVRNAGGPNL